MKSPLRLRAVALVPSEALSSARDASAALRWRHAKAAHRRHAQWALLPDQRSAAGRGADPRAAIGCDLRQRARRGTVPLRRVEEQAVLRWHAQRDRFLRPQAQRRRRQPALALRRQARHHLRQSRHLLACRTLQRWAQVRVPLRQGTVDRSRWRGGGGDHRHHSQMSLRCAELRDRRRTGAGSRAATESGRHRQWSLCHVRWHRAEGRRVRRRRVEGALHTVPLRRVEEQAVLRRQPLERGVSRPLDYSAVAPVRRTVAAFLAVSARITAAISSGLIGAGSKPKSFMRSRTSGADIRRLTSALILRPSSLGVPRGAATPLHESISKPAGPPASSIVGTSGALAMRCLAAIAITLMRPALMSGSAEPMVENAQWMSPLAMPMYICDWSL